MDHKIIWEKWVDPFGENTDETKWNHYDDNDLDEQTEFFNDELLKSKLEKPVKVIATPMGLIPYNEYSSCSSIFNFWVGHTSFNISKSIIDIIEKCYGVEILDVFTRYRFRVGIGKCFTDSDVMKSISDRIINYLENKNGNTIE